MSYTQTEAVHKKNFYFIDCQNDSYESTPTHLMTDNFLSFFKIFLIKEIMIFHQGVTVCISKSAMHINYFSIDCIYSHLSRGEERNIFDQCDLVA